LQTPVFDAGSTYVTGNIALVGTTFKCMATARDYLPHDEAS